MLYPLPPRCSLPAPRTSAAFSESRATWGKMGERKLQPCTVHSCRSSPSLLSAQLGAPALNQLWVISVAPCEMPAHTASCGQATRSVLLWLCLAAPVQRHAERCPSPDILLASLCSSALVVKSCAWLKSKPAEILHPRARSSNHST